MGCRPGVAFTVTVWIFEYQPFFAGPDYDPRLVLIQAAGTATLEFRQTPGAEGIARFTYTVNNVAATKPIQRMVF